MARRRTIASNPLDELGAPGEALGFLLSPMPPPEGERAEPTSDSDVIEARKLVLRDAHGRVRAEVSADEDVVFTLRDSGGVGRVELRVEADGRARVLARDGQREIRAVVDVTAEGRPTVVLGDPGERPRLAFGVSRSGQSFFTREPSK